MGNLGGVEGNGVVVEDHVVVRDPDSSSTISKDYWVAAEEAVQEVLNCIHPTLGSEEKRNDVIDYVHRLLKCSLGFEVFPFGSVPLKTYLPDGDIDLTALGNPCVEEFWASEVLSVLQWEEQNAYAEYEVKDTHVIDAEVKLVKCIVQNIVIDISFNQMGGVCTLCFLEQVDRLIGKNHIFKRSIILIKAWCYYESRILGSNHGLLSTYALETLILHIFQLFHSSLDGPLSVLYKFLEYFSRFDWDNYCISVNGPVCKSSLPDVVVEMPENHGNNLLLSGEFLSNCAEMFAVPFSDSDSNSRAFLPKHLNIIDPLRVYNNLGRSVHRANFYRIRCAFKYGARKLGRIMSLPIEEIANEIKKFFSSTLQRHLYKNGCGAEINSPFSSEGSRTLHSLLSSEGFSVDDMLMRSYTGDFGNGGLETSERSYSANGSAVSGICRSGNSYDVPAYSSLDFRGLNGTTDFSSNGNHNNSSLGQYYYAPQFSLDESSADIGSFYQTGPSDGLEGNPEANPWLQCSENHPYIVDTYQPCADDLDSYCSSSSGASSRKTSILESLSVDFSAKDAVSLIDTEPLNPLADLTGDHDSHIRNLSYWQCCQGIAQFAPAVAMAPALPSQFPRETACGTFYQSVASLNTVFMQPPASVSVPTSVYASEGNCKIQGVGTYLPSMNFSCRERSRNAAPESRVQMKRNNRNNGYVPCFVEKSSSEKSSPREALNGKIPFSARKKSGNISEGNHSNEGEGHANGSFSNSSCTIEFGSLGPLVDEEISGSACSKPLTEEPIALQDKGNLMSGSNTKKERDEDCAFHLKNDEEFPALAL